MNNMEIQEEAIIEIVGTQYAGRAVNHRNLIYQQNLIIKHQKNNIHDHNAVVILTDDDKELGFMPKGYASLYAPALDSGKYRFTVEIVKTEPDPKRPILIVKITSELKNYSEEDIEKDIITFIQNIINSYNHEKTAYLKYISAETVDVDELLSVLNRVRLIQKLHSYSIDIIESHGIEQTSEKYTSLTKVALIKQLNDLIVCINDVLKKIQKAYNESFDIDNEEEYYRVQSEIRERRKKFRSYNNLLVSFLDAVNSYTDISVIHSSVSSAQEIIEILPITEPKKHEPALNTEPEHETVISEETMFTEKSFFDWLISEGGVSDTTAKQYISNIHSIEKLYQTLFGDRRCILGAISANNVKDMIEILLQRSEYIDANERRHNSFSASLNKFAQFARIPVDVLKDTTEKKNYQSPISTETFVIKKVDFNKPNNCTYYKPCSFIMNGLKYSVGSWCELYTEYLRHLYIDNNYAEILKGLIGKSLYGRRIDFADITLVKELRKAIKVSADFFAEGNLSAVDIIKHIKCLMELCSIDDDHMIIEYSTQEKENKSVIPDDNDNTGTNSKIKNHDSTDLKIQKSYAVDIKKTDSDGVNVSGLASDNEKNDYSSVNTSERNAVEQNLRSQRLLSEETSANDDNDLAVSQFSPDISKPFVLKDAVVEILSSNAPDIMKYREYKNKNGISSKNLRELIKAYYGKTISLFEISKLLMLDKVFRSAGKGCYILNTTMIPNKEAESKHTELDLPTKEDQPIEDVTKTIRSDRLPVSYEEDKVNALNVQNSEELKIETILEVIKENSDNLQYEYGFGPYEVKNLLTNKGITNITEEQIEILMSECTELQEIEDGYYSLIEKEYFDEVSMQQIVGVDDDPKIETETIGMEISNTFLQEQQKASEEIRHIDLNLNNSTVQAYDYSDALIKVCEFSINCKPFEMARITRHTIQLHGNSVFYRKTVPVDGYNMLSNGLQLIKIDSLSDLRTITAEVQKYCQIPDDMITIISQ